MFSLGIILARAGSKGIPNKCMHPLRGRPLIDYTFEHARESERLSAVLLSTDCGPARELACERGIAAIARPADLATDTATVDDAARHAVLAWELEQRREVEAVVLLYGNIPVRPAGAIDRALAMLADTGACSVRTIAPVGKHHPDWLHRCAADGTLAQYRVNSIYRRQELEPLYYHDGAVVAVTRSALFAAAGSDDAHAFFGRDRRGLVVPAGEAVDVDEPTDLLLAEAALAGREGGRA